LERKTVDICRRVLGPDHPQTAASVYNLGVIEANSGNRTEALSLLRQALDHGLFPTGALGMEKDSGLESLQGDPQFDPNSIGRNGRADEERRSPGGANS